MFNFNREGNIKRNIRIVIIVSAVLTIVFLLNVLVSAYLLRRNSIQDRSHQVVDLTIVLAEHTAQILFSANAALNIIIENINLERFDNEKSYLEFASKKSQFEVLQDVVKSNGILDVSTYVSKSGKVINFSRSFPAPDIDLSNRDYFQYLSVNNDTSTFYSKPVKNKGNDKWVFYLAHRINGRNNEFLGIVLIGVSVEVFSLLYEKIGGRLGDGSSLVLYRKDKALITRWPLVEDLIGQINTNGLIENSLSHLDNNGGVIFTSEAGFTRKNNEPVMRMTAYRNVDRYPFIVCITLPESLYLVNWYKNLSGVFFATGSSLITLFIGTFFLIRIYRHNAYNQYRADYDSLTELPNRLLFEDRLQTAMTDCKRNTGMLALFFIDLDNFKVVNDVHGHLAGDFLLKEIASRIKACLRESDTIGRFGGDEFLVMLPGIDSAASATTIAEKIRQAICQTMIFEGKVMSVGSSIGIALYPDHGLNKVDLMINADTAMYEAKSAGRDTIKVFGDSSSNGVATYHPHASDGLNLYAKGAQLLYESKRLRKNLLFEDFRQLQLNSNKEPTFQNEKKVNQIDKFVMANKDKAGSATDLVIARMNMKFANIKAEQSELQLLSSLVALAKARDHETGNHIIRTQRYVKALALRVRSEGYYLDRLSDASIESLFRAAPLHDIGKIGIPDSILLKNESLTAKEWDIMKTHTLIGESALDAAHIEHHSDSDVITKAIKIAGGHHENWNGTGYPRGLAGAAIPLEARIMSVADMYDALVSERIYKKAWSHTQAVQEIISNSGTRFDPVIVEAFIIEQDNFKEISHNYKDS